MSFDVPAGALIRAGTGIMLAAVGALIVARVRKPAGWALGLMYVLLGADHLVSNFTIHQPELAVPGLAFSAVMILGAVVAGAASIWLVPTRLRPGQRKPVFWVLAAAVLFAAPLTVIVETAADADLPKFIPQIAGAGLDATGLLLLRLYILSLSPLLVLFPTLLFALAIRVRSGPDYAPAAATGIVALAMALDSGIEDGFFAGSLAAVKHDAFGLVVLVPYAAVVGAWLWAGTGAGGRAARNAGLGILAVPTLGFLLVLAVGPANIDAADSAVGVGRIVEALVLAYAVFHLDFLGTGRTSSWPNPGTLVVAGLGVLFIVAQVLQNVLSATWGLYIGGGMAGVVLFAAYPVQRLAERLLDRRGRPARAAKDAREIYGRSLSIALSDGRLSDREEEALAELAEHLGLDHRSVLEVRRAARVQPAGAPRLRQPKP